MTKENKASRKRLGLARTEYNRFWQGHRAQGKLEKIPVRTVEFVQTG